MVIMLLTAYYASTYSDASALLLCSRIIHQGLVHSFSILILQGRHQLLYWTAHTGKQGGK